MDSNDRRADLPVDQQVRLATGVIWTRDERWRVGGFLELIDLGSADLESGVFFGGAYDPNRIFMVGVNFQYFPGAGR